MAHDPKPVDDLAKAPPTAHRRSDAIAKAQIILPVFAVLAALGFGLTEWLARGEARYTPGPLAAVHSQWETQCAACHATSQPLAASNWFAKATAQDHVADAKCQGCHAGPPHHASQKAAEVVGCTACHREHQGTPGRLLAVADSHCTVCHADLANHFAATKPTATTFQNVAGFGPSTHPEFAALRPSAVDPGTVSFNHALHMIPGMGTDPQKPGPFTLAQMSPADREHYRKPMQADNIPVSLDCRSCHQTDGNTVRGDGAAMAPIVFEQHCQACHPLTIDRKIPGDPKSELLTLRHRQQPKEILEALQGHYTHLHLKGLWSPPTAPAGTLPGKPANPLAAAKEIDANAEAAALKLLVAQQQNVLAQKVLGQTTCQKCHAALDPAKGVNQTVPPANIPAVWFQHARFDHTAHRAIDCRECHEQAFPGAKGSTKSTDILLPGVAVCMKCHAPAQGDGATASGGARYDCILCHAYHHGDAPLQGRGSAARQPSGHAKSIQELISGK